MTSDEAVIFASNVAPQNVNAGPNRIVNEGETVALAVSFTDPGTIDTHTLAWVVTRNSAVFATGSGTSFSFVPTDQGVYSVSVTVTDSNGAVGTDQLQVTASNVAPAINPGGPYFVSEGGSLSLSAVVQDGGAEDVPGISWDINGDGIYGDASAAGPVLTWPQLIALGIANGPGDFNVSVRANDFDGGITQSLSVPLTLANVRPQNVEVNLVSPAAQEGSPVVLSGTFSDPGSGEAHTYFWEATTTTGQTIASVTGVVLPGKIVPNFSFVPGNDGPYFARLTIDDGAETGSGLLTIAVANVSPRNVTLQAANLQVPLGQPLLVSGGFQDPGTDSWRATLEVRPAGGGPAALRLPLILDGSAGGSSTFATSLVIAQTGHFEIFVHVDDGVQTSSSNMLLVTSGAPGSATVVGRHVFYNGSFFDGGNAAANSADDGAIDPSKTALLPGQTATKANYISYTRGINGIMVDIVGATKPIELSDFEFHDMGRAGNSPTTAPLPTGFTVRAGAGIGGADRVTFIWDTTGGAVFKNTWLRVTVGTSLGLEERDVFCFGSAPGEGSGGLFAHVDPADELGARNNGHGFTNPATVDDPWDYNKDRFVDPADQLFVRNNTTGFANRLNLFTAPAIGELSSGAIAEGLFGDPARVWASRTPSADSHYTPIGEPIDGSYQSAAVVLEERIWEEDDVAEDGLMGNGNTTNSFDVALEDDSLWLDSEPWTEF
ncbi:MAG: PKD domain-containing protein [Pirellulales bacterium]